MKSVVIMSMLFGISIACSGCSGGDNSAQVQPLQAQITTLQAKLSAVQTQLSSAKTDGSTYSTGLNTAITSLTQTQSALATLSGQPASTNTTPLTTASNQVLVLQSLADSLSSNTSTLPTAYTASQQSLATLTSQLSIANAQVTSLTIQLATNQSSSSVADQLTAANAQVTTLTGQITMLSAASASLQSQLDAANGTVATQGTQLTAFTGQVTTLIANNSNLTGQLAAVNTQIVALNGQITALSTQISSLNTSDTALTVNNANLNTQLDTANTTLTSLTEQVAALQGQLDAATATNADLINQLAVVTDTTTSLTIQVSSLTMLLIETHNDVVSRITALSDQIAALNATISTMVAAPVVMSIDSPIVTVPASVAVSVAFPTSEAGKIVTFSTTAANGNLTPVSTVIATDGTATTTFNSSSVGTVNIYALEGLYCGGAVVQVLPTPAPTYSVSGTIALNSTGLQNVIVTLTGGVTNSTTTDSSGNYSFAGLTNGTSYKITPALSGYSFMPSSITGTISGNVSSQNFTDIITQTYSCSGTLSPLGRWCDNDNGTVRDMTTGLVWLQNANCTATLGGVMSGSTNSWSEAINWSSYLASPNVSCGLTDGSAAGEWALPTKSQFKTLTTGTEAVIASTPGPFNNVYGLGDSVYWSSSSYSPGDPLIDFMINGGTEGSAEGGYYSAYVWPVRNGQ